MVTNRKAGQIKMYFVFVIYVLLSAGALTLIKIGAHSASVLAIDGGVLNLRIGLWMIIGLVLYIVSFLLSLSLISSFNLNYYYPISAGAIYLVVAVFAAVFLKEQMSLAQYAGMGLILAGVILMNLKK